LEHSHSPGLQKGGVHHNTDNLKFMQEAASKRVHKAYKAFNKIKQPWPIQHLDGISYWGTSPPHQYIQDINMEAFPCHEYAQSSHGSCSTARPHQSECSGTTPHWLQLMHSGHHKKGTWRNVSRWSWSELHRGCSPPSCPHHSSISSGTHPCTPQLFHMSWMGTFNPPLDCNPMACHLLVALQWSLGVTSIGTRMHNWCHEQMAEGERGNSFFPFSNHFRHNDSNVQCKSANLGLHTGYSPKWWQTDWILCVKNPRQHKCGKLCIILLFGADSSQNH